MAFSYKKPTFPECLYFWSTNNQYTLPHNTKLIAAENWGKLLLKTYNINRFLQAQILGILEDECKVLALILQCKVIGHKLPKYTGEFMHWIHTTDTTQHTHTCMSRHSHMADHVCPHTDKCLRNFNTIRIWISSGFKFLWISCGLLTHKIHTHLC